MKNIIKEWLEKRFTLTDTNKWGEWLSIGSKTGISVTESSALRATAVWACVRLLSETVASLPLFVYRRVSPRGKERAVNHPLYSLLHDTPNPEMTSYTFREMLQAHLLTWGNCYAEIEYGNDGYGTGYPKALWPLLPGQMQVERVKGQIIYLYTLPDGRGITIPNYRVLHIPGLGYNGLVGYSPIRMAKEAIGLSLATEEFGARFFGNGSTFGGFLEHPNKMSKEAQDRFLKAMEEKHQGLSQAHRLAILEEGMKYHSSGIPPEDAQFLETRQFQVSEIARFFHIPPHMIGDLTKATFSNIEHQTIEYAVYTVRPWLVRWEQGLDKKLLSDTERKQLFIEHLIDGLLRGDSQSRAAFYKDMFMMGSMSPDDIREKENMNPLPDGMGESYFIPLNMMPLGGTVPPEEAPIEEDKLKLLTEQRTNRKRSAIARHKVTLAHKANFEAAGVAIVKREKENVQKALKKCFKERSLILWNDWLDQFYREFTKFISQQIAGPVEEMVKDMMPMVAQEVNASPEVWPDIQEYVAKYAEIFARDYAKSSWGQLRQVGRLAEQEGTNPQEAIEERLYEWEERRPGKIGMDETIKCGNILAKTVFLAAGFVNLIWVTCGKPCEFCQELDGKVVGKESKFSVGGFSPASTPPIHEGCQCQIIAG